ncbi:hypothetical protein ABH930_004221 [Kitasatospora sp. GAS204A]|nr:hypothetical protein [Kitasatospora sp. GAS204B]
MRSATDRRNAPRAPDGNRAPVKWIKRTIYHHRRAITPKANALVHPSMCARTGAPGSGSATRSTPGAPCTTARAAAARGRRGRGALGRRRARRVAGTARRAAGGPGSGRAAATGGAAGAGRPTRATGARRRPAAGARATRTRRPRTTGGPDAMPAARPPGRARRTTDRSGARRTAERPLCIGLLRRRGHRDHAAGLPGRRRGARARVAHGCHLATRRPGRRRGTRRAPTPPAAPLRPRPGPRRGAGPAGRPPARPGRPRGVPDRLLIAAGPDLHAARRTQPGERQHSRPHRHRAEHRRPLRSPDRALRPSGDRHPATAHPRRRRDPLPARPHPPGDGPHRRTPAARTPARTRRNHCRRLSRTPHPGRTDPRPLVVPNAHRAPGTRPVPHRIAPTGRTITWHALTAPPTMGPWT